MTALRALNYRPFALLWTGQTISAVGDALYGIALTWWVLQKTGSALVMGTTLILSLAPRLIFLLLGGVVVDRFSRVRLMLVSDIVRGLVVAVVAFMALTGSLELVHVYAAIIIFGAVGAFFGPAFMALIPQLMPSRLLPSANSLTTMTGQMIGIIGPALAGGVVAVGGTGSAFLLDAFSFFISAAFLVALLPCAGQPVSSARSSGLISQLREGLDFVMRISWLWTTILLAAFGNILLAAPEVALPFLLTRELHADVAAFGLFGSLTSIGSILGALWLGRQTRIRRRGIRMYATFIAGSLGVMLIGLPISLLGVLGAGFLMGLTFAIGSLIWLNLLQEYVPQGMMGRVMSIDQVGSFVFLPVAYVLIGFLVDRFGAPLVFAFGGGLATLLLGLGMLNPAIRRLD